MANVKVKIGFNDVNTTNKELADLFLKEEDKYKYTQFSNKRVDFKCSNCESKILQKKISDVNIYGLSCSYCRDNISFPEKVIREVLKFLNLKFEYDKDMKWENLNKRRYDFYIKSHNIIIEIHGKQHYNGGFEKLGGKNKQEEIKNDIIKKELAIKNNINEYIVINASKSEISYISENIKNSRLSELFDLSKIDWFEINKKANTSINYQCLLEWNNGLRDIKLISEKLNLHKEMVRRYLKQWSNLNKCDYNVTDERVNLVLQLDENMNLLKEWKSVKEIVENTDFKRELLDKNLNNISKEAYGFIWRYKTKKRNGSRSKKITKYTLNNKKLETYESLTKLCLITNYTMSHISNCCNGKRDQAYGFIWKYEY